MHLPGHAQETCRALCSRIMSNAHPQVLRVQQRGEPGALDAIGIDEVDLAQRVQRAQDVQPVISKRLHAPHSVRGCRAEAVAALVSAHAQHAWQCLHLGVLQREALQTGQLRHLRKQSALSITHVRLQKHIVFASCVMPGQAAGRSWPGSRCM
jgi:hypothetical protein